MSVSGKSIPAWRILGCALAITGASLFAAPATAGQPVNKEMIAAIRAGDTDRVERLLEAGVDPDVTGTVPRFSGKTALMWAAQREDGEILDLLLAAGAQVDATNANGGTALMYAAAKGRVEHVQTLIEQGADVNARARYGWSPILVATMKRRIGVLEVLLEHGADVNSRDVYGWTPLMRAAEVGNTDVARFLLQHGADPRVTDVNGASALAIAQKLGHDETAAVLRGSRNGGSRVPAVQPD